MLYVFIPCNRLNKSQSRLDVLVSRLMLAMNMNALGFLKVNHNFKAINLYIFFISALLLILLFLKLLS